MLNVWDELYTYKTIQDPAGYTRADWGKSFGSFNPWAAEKISVSGDGLTWTVNLRKGVKSPAGNEFTSADVVWWMQRKAHYKGTGAFGDGIVGWSLDSVQVVDKSTLSFTTKAPNPLALEGLANIFQNAVDSKEMMKHATASDPWAADWAKTHAAGYGPYQLVSFEPGNQAVFQANPNYWAGPPPIKRVIEKEIPESATRLQLLEAGQIDLTRGLTIGQFSQAATASNLKVVSVKGTFEAMGQINLSKGGPLADRRVRQALQMLTPQQQIVNTVYDQGKAARVWPDPIMDIYAGYKGGWQWNYNQDAAKKLLADAGYGRGFTVNIMFSNEFPTLEQTAVILKSAWSQAGINVVIDKLPRAAYADRKVGGKFDVSLDETQAFLVDTQYYLNLWFKSHSFYNYGQYNNPQIDQIIAEAGGTLDQAKRTQLFQQADDILSNDMPWVFLAQVNNEYAMRSNLQGFVYYPSTCMIWRHYSFS